MRGLCAPRVCFRVLCVFDVYYFVIRKSGRARARFAWFSPAFLRVCLFTTLFTIIVSSSVSSWPPFSS